MNNNNIISLEKFCFLISAHCITQLIFPVRNMNKNIVYCFHSIECCAFKYDISSLCCFFIFLDLYQMIGTQVSIGRGFVRSCCKRELAFQPPRQPMQLHLAFYIEFYDNHFITQAFKPNQAAKLADQARSAQQTPQPYTATSTGGEATGHLINWSAELSDTATSSRD